MDKTILVALAFMSLALAGCADEPPAGEFAKTGHALSLQGGVQSATYTPESRPASEQSGGVVDQCWPDAIPEDPLNYSCVPASSEVTFHFMSLPDPDGQSYTVDAYDSAGAGRMSLGALGDADETGMYNFVAMEDEDLSATYDSYQLMLGDHLVATGGLTGDMTLNPALTQGSFEATYSGRDLTITTTGMSADFTFEGWLVSVDDAGVKTHDVSFSVAGDGETTFRAPSNVADYQEFHIHVTGTKLNVAVATIA